MIKNYLRPTSLQEALTLLEEPDALPMGGGTLLSQPTTDPITVVDLQALGMHSFSKTGNELAIGATATLQSLLNHDHLPLAWKKPLQLEAPLNIRNAATVAGAIVSSDGRSTIAGLLLAVDSKIEKAQLDKSEIQYQTSSIGEFLPLRGRGLITRIICPLNVKFAFEHVSRTPADKPIVFAAVAQWKSGRTRLVLGGYGKSPLLAMDGTESNGIETAARNAFHEAKDEFASAEYRMEIAVTLAKRCLDNLGE